MDNRPIGILDSGVGGLSVLREIRKEFPNENLVYFADQAHVPYGPRSSPEITKFLIGITYFFLKLNVKTIVIACNTATAAGINEVRKLFPSIDYVGMEPAVKPAAANTKNRTIGVIATKTTCQSKLFHSLIDRFAKNVDVITQVCPKFVTLVENGDLNSPLAERIAINYLNPLKRANIDQLVLGCTHFPFLTPLFKKIVGSNVEIVDPSPAVARQTGRLIAQSRNNPASIGSIDYYTSGNPQNYLDTIQRLINQPIKQNQIHSVTWKEYKITEKNL